MRIDATRNVIDFVVKEGVRFVKPYSKTHSTFAKERWYGRELLSCYMDEFSIPEYICVDMIETGRILVNGERAKASHVLAPTDRVSVNDVFIEKPILDFDHLHFIKNKLHNSSQYADSFWAVQKPCAVPVHAVGKFVKNTLHYILKTEYNISKPMRFAHRLDKCTSGVLIFADTAEATRRYNTLSFQNQILKCYLARVHGRFPNIYSESSEAPYIHHIRYPVRCTNQRRGLWDPVVPGAELLVVDSSCRESDVPKDAYTQIIGIHYDEASDTSIVLCRPLTGRTHQIRCHLRGMGFNIVDDIRVPDMPDPQRIAWERKYSIIKEYGHDEDKCCRMFLELSMKDFFNSTFLPHEFRIDLHSCHYESEEFRFEIDEYPPWVTNLVPSNAIEGLIKTKIQNCIDELKRLESCSSQGK